MIVIGNCRDKICDMCLCFVATVKCISSGLSECYLTSKLELTKRPFDSLFLKQEQKLGRGGGAIARVKPTNGIGYGCLGLVY